MQSLFSLAMPFIYSPNAEFSIDLFCNILRIYLMTGEYFKLMKFEYIVLFFMTFNFAASANGVSSVVVSKGYSDPNMYFSASKFDTWEIRCRFTTSDEPTYWYESGDWGQPFDSRKNGYKKTGPNSKAGSYELSGLIYYLYKGKNPLALSADGYDSEISKRFYFYRFSGKAAKLQSLDNYLIAVDIYTKLVFAFAIPTNYKNILWKMVPTAWGRLEDNLDSQYKFYEYDPVGIVRADGTFEMYEWHLKDMANHVYIPTMKAQGYEVATYGKPGCSPYCR